MKKVLLALCICAALSTAAGATAASVPANICKTEITPAFVKAVTGVTVFVNPKLSSMYSSKTGSVNCEFSSADSINNALELTIARYPVGSASAAKFFATVSASGAKATANQARCWSADQMTFPDPLAPDCAWTPVAGPWKAAAVWANQMFIEFPHAMMFLMTGGLAQSDPNTPAAARTFTYDQMIAVAKAAIPKIKP